MRHLLSVFATLLCLLGLTALSVGAGAQSAGSGAVAGTIIVNQATGVATPDEPGARPITVVSNEVRTEIVAVCALGLTPDGTPQAPGQRQGVLPGERGVFPYTLTNSGNQRVVARLGTLIAPGADFAPSSLALYLDVSGNGVIDGPDAPVTSLELPVGGRAALLLAVDTAPAALGRVLVSPTVTCPADLGGGSDVSNYAELRVGDPPKLALSKSFSPAQLRPGETSTVILSARNGGLGASREVIVTDPLTTPELAGLSYLPGSASASLGTVEYSAGGSVWQTGEPPTVAAIRLRLPSLAPGQLVSLRFQMRASAGADGLSARNTATLTSPADPSVQLSASATLTARYTPGVGLGPAGNPTAPEGSDADQQTQPVGVVGQPLCFVHTLQNTGDVADSYTIATNLAGGQADVVLGAPDGRPLAQPVELQPGQRLDVRVCLTPRAGEPLRLVLTATGTRGTSNATTDLIDRVELQLPGLLKTVEPSGSVAAGAELTYTLSVTNPYDRPLAGVVLTDPLNANLKFVSASDGGRLAAGTVTWTLGTLAPNETRRVTLRAQVLDSAPDGSTIANAFAFSAAEFANPLTSPPVQTPVWSASLGIQKSVSPQQASVGDRLTYTVNLRNLSQGGALGQLDVTDTLPVGLEYIPGTAKLGGAALPDPSIENGRVMRWSLPGLAAGAGHSLTYQTRVTPQAGDQPINVVIARGVGLNGAVVPSQEARAKLKLSAALFAPVTDLIGQVYVDRNRDGSYQAGFDTPLARARVILAGGRIALTDAQGRYHFAGVPEGLAALRLDPSSVPYRPLSVPQDGGRPGSREVYARGLTSVDFPLAALVGEAEAGRETSLRQGPLSLAKSVLLQDDGSSRVTLTLNSAQALPGFVLDDPLPAGTALVEGVNRLALDLPAGPTTLSYRFAPSGPAACGPACATTDPTVHWGTK